MIVETLEEQRQRQMNHNFYTNEPMTSSSTYDESPLRAFLRSNGSANDPKGALDSKVSSVDLDLLSPSPLPGSRNKTSQYDQVGHDMYYEDSGKTNLPFCLDEVVQGRNANQDSDVFMQDNSFSHKTLDNLKPIPIKESEFKERQQPKKNVNVLSKEEAKESLMQSYQALNKLMERTASSRCLLLEQSKKNNNRPSEPLMKSLSTTAFKTIVTSNKITSSISATSFRNITSVPESFTTSDCINSSFDGIIQYGEQQPKKRRTSFKIEPNSITPTLNSSRTSEDLRQVSVKTSEDLRQVSVSGVEPSVSSLMNSLPSCGSLADMCTERERPLERAVQNPSPFPPVEISTAIQITPVGRKDIVFGGSIPPNKCIGDVQSCGSMDSSSSRGGMQRFEQVIQTLPSPSALGMSSSFQTRNKINQSTSSQGLGMSSSFQTRNEFNSFQAPPGKIDQTACSLGLGMSNSFHTRNKLKSFQTSPGKIDQLPSQFGLEMSSSLQSRNKFNSFQAPPSKINQSTTSLGISRSNSFQTKRKFNSFHAPNHVSDQSPRFSIRDSSLEDLPLIFQRQGNISQNSKPDKISDTMKLKLRRELQRTTTKVGAHEQSNSSWFSNTVA